MKPLIFPMPPSVNNCYGTNFKTKRRFKTKEYEKWLKDCENVFWGRKIKISGDNWLEVKYCFYFSLYTLEGKKRIKDTGNYEKPTSDMLSAQIKGFKDHKIKRIISEKFDSQKKFMTVEIYEIQ